MEKVTKGEMNTLPKIIAVDFDGTLVEDEFPAIGKPIPHMWELIKNLREQGVKLILWSCRNHENLTDAVEYCKREHGFIFDAVNENIKEVQEMFHNDTRKVYADLYIDDKSIPHNLTPVFWAERLGLTYTLTGGWKSGY